MISCIAFSEKVNNIDEGMRVTVNGDINLYTIKGSYQLKVQSIFQKGKGELWQEYLLLKDKLEKEGVFLRKYKKN